MPKVRCFLVHRIQLDAGMYGGRLKAKYLIAFKVLETRVMVQYSEFLGCFGQFPGIL